MRDIVRPIPNQWAGAKPAVPKGGNGDATDFAHLAQVYAKL